mmetsp:Transcript_71046/g.219667  ORF Transcript_71046/g.219667 Transcript_71046/m.219667 type:complete len:301 (-) Transcript_71046:44-946(-)
MCQRGRLQVRPCAGYAGRQHVARPQADAEEREEADRAGRWIRDGRRPRRWQPEPVARFRRLRLQEGRLSQAYRAEDKRRGGGPLQALDRVGPVSPLGLRWDLREGHQPGARRLHPATLAEPAAQLVARAALGRLLSLLGRERGEEPGEGAGHGLRQHDAHVGGLAGGQQSCRSRPHGRLRGWGQGCGGQPLQGQRREPQTQGSSDTAPHHQGRGAAHRALPGPAAPAAHATQVAARRLAGHCGGWGPRGCLTWLLDKCSDARYKLGDQGGPACEKGASCGLDLRGRELWSGLRKGGILRA